METENIHSCEYCNIGVQDRIFHGFMVCNSCYKLLISQGDKNVSANRNRD